MPGLLRNNLGDMIRVIREERGWSQRELARRAATSQRIINALENNKYNATLEFLDRIAKVLGVNIEINVWIRR